MPRAALIVAGFLGALASLGGTGAGGGGLDPHLDPSMVRGGCAACHKGHGASRSPMLAGPQKAGCLTCHGSRASLDSAVRKGDVSGSARPGLLDGVLAQPYAHPMGTQAYSEREAGAVTCTSCHSPHRGTRDKGGAAPPARRRASTKDPRRFEYELCEGCHGSRGTDTQSLADISRLLNPGNASFHPVEAPSRDSSPSLLAGLSGREVNCTDCHGNSDPGGPRGPHGSGEPFLLRARYATLDGSPESPASYALCYTCHRRETLLASTAFPEHGKHVVDVKAACATCHDPHGSVRNRSLIRFGEETFVAGVSPSARAGRLAFVSDGPGSGACYVTCHGRDHAPEAYGPMKARLDLGVGALRTSPLGPQREPWGDPSRPPRAAPPDRDRGRPASPAPPP